MTTPTIPGTAQMKITSLCRRWRKDRDLNPGGAFTPTGFRDRRIKPLCHPSAKSPFVQRNERGWKRQKQALPLRAKQRKIRLISKYRDRFSLLSRDRTSCARKNHAFEARDVLYASVHGRAKRREAEVCPEKCGDQKSVFPLLRCALRRCLWGVADHIALETLFPFVTFAREQTADIVALQAAV